MLMLMLTVKRMDGQVFPLLLVFLSYVNVMLHFLFSYISGMIILKLFSIPGSVRPGIPNLYLIKDHFYIIIRSRDHYVCRYNKN